MNAMTTRARRGIRILVAHAALTLTVTGCMMHGPPPQDLDTARTRVTERGLYQSTIVPAAEPIPINRMHQWTVEVRTPSGEPVERAAIHIDGGMPQHGHGLPTSPRVTGELGEGRYAVEGMRFNMRGWWTISLKIDGPSGEDAVTFNLML